MSSPDSDEDSPARPYVTCLSLTGMDVLIVGGGAVATRKLHSLTDTGANITVVSPEATDDIAAMAAVDALAWLRRPFEPPDTDGQRLVFAATADRTVNARVAQEANRRGIWVNVADAPDDGTFHVPATVRRGGLTISVSTGGASPMLSARIREKLQREYGIEYADYVGLLERARSVASTTLPDESDRRRFYAAILESDILDQLRHGYRDAADAAMQRLLQAARHDGKTRGRP